MSNRRRLFVAANFLHLQYINCVFFGAEGEGEEFLKAIGLLLLQHSGIGFLKRHYDLLAQAAAG